MSESAVLDAAAKETPAAAASTPAANAGTPSAAAPVAAAPESYPLTLSTGSLLEPAALTRITERAKALGVADPKLAQAFVEVAEAETAAAFQTFQASRQFGGEGHKALVAEFTKAALAHPEVGNNDPVQMEKRSHEAGLFLAEHAPGLLPVLKDTGYAAHPEVIATFSRLFRSSQESPIASGNPTADDASKPLPNRMYPGGIKLTGE